MNKRPQFSIITICFNSEATIERTIKSVLAQTFTDYEYIIVDGGSKDSTLDIVKKYEPLFEGRMKWKSEPDKGIYDAMNKGIERSSGTIIGIVNSDDWLEPDALKVISEMSMNNLNKDDALYCGSIYFHYKNGDSQLFVSNMERFYKGIPHHSYNYGLFHPATFVGKNVYQTVGLFDTKFEIEADSDFIYRCYVYGKLFLFTDIPLSNMSDCGASNVISIPKYYNEKRYFIKKNNINGFSAIVLMCKFLIRITIKKYTPTLFIKYLRSKVKER